VDVRPLVAKTDPLEAEPPGKRINSDLDPENSRII
jgi:hypothetical protein